MCMREDEDGSFVLYGLSCKLSGLVMSEHSEVAVELHDGWPWLAIAADGTLRVLCGM
jgi:hypothetical protein